MMFGITKTKLPTKGMKGENGKWSTKMAILNLFALCVSSFLIKLLPLFCSLILFALNQTIYL